MAEKRPTMPPESSPVDQDLIRELAKLLDETGLTEIEIEQDGLRVRVAPQARDRAWRRRPRTSAPPAIAPAPPASSRRPATRRKHPGVVTSPMVGTAYLGARARRQARSSRSAAR